MSHQVIITFDMDEERIQENAEKEAGRQIARNVMDVVSGSSYNREGVVKRYVQQVIKEMLEPEKDQIIKEAIAQVVENLHRTKAVKEKIAQLGGQD